MYGLPFDARIPNIETLIAVPVNDHALVDSDIL
jgi:hypothetical protein